MNICSLRRLVYDGWTIANRKALAKVIGKDEITKLGKAYECLDRHQYEISSLARTGHKIWIPSGEISLKMRDEQYLLSFPAQVGDFYVRKNTQSFIGKDINIKTITARVKAFEKDVVDYFKNAKELPKSSLESKTMKKLFSSEFKPSRRFNEDGLHVTTLIDKKTGKPVEAYVKPLEINDVHETWEIYVKNSTGKYELVGSRRFEIDRDKGKILPGWMNSNGGQDRYEGIGLREHQIGVERMMQENLKTVEICAEAQAYPFHYKSGFRVIPMEMEVPQERLNRVLNNWVERSGIDAETLKKNMVSKVVDGKTIVHSQTVENWRNLLYLKNNGRYMNGDTPMDLHGEWLGKWKQMALSQPILLDV